LLKENPLKMSEFPKNKYFFNEISPSYVVIPENEKAMSSFSKENVLVLPEFLKNKNLIIKNLEVLPEFLKNKYFVNKYPNFFFLFLSF
jgi:hypothetical protein